MAEEDDPPRNPGLDAADAHYEMGLAYREMGLFDDALTEFTAAVDGGSVQAKLQAVDLLFRRAAAFEAADELTDASLSYQRVLAFDPAHAASKRSLLRLGQRVLLA
jgi:tetratricopeptide (TPR) repeat protein